MMKKIKIGFNPLLGLCREDGGEDGWSRWQSVDNDPQFLICKEEEGDWEQGWYHLQIQLTGEPGGIVGPCIYPDYGGGFGEINIVPLWYRQDEDKIDCIIVLIKPAKSLRFDPTVRKAFFSLGDAFVRRIPRVAAYWGMISSVCESRGGQTGSVWYAFIRSLFFVAKRQGVRQAVAELRINYLSKFSNVCSSYQGWVRIYDPPVEWRSRELEERKRGLSGRPLFSVIMPVYNPPEKWFRRALDSVLAQVYENWEICVADDASTERHVLKVLEEYSSKDGRVKYISRNKNGHISEASNSALEIARGDFLVLLDHDDELHPEALLCVAEALGKNPDAKIIYSDEDKIDEDGVRFGPYFKTDWNYELLLGQNCISHLGVYEAGLVREVGGFRVGMEGSQDWDLALRCIEKIKSSQIIHIPKVLYHWRTIPGSTSMGVHEKSYAAVAAESAVIQHFERIGVMANVVGGNDGYIRSEIILPERKPLVSLIVPTRDKVDLLKVCVGSIIEKTKYENFDIIIVDNGSVESGTLDYFRFIQDDFRVRVVSYDAEFNYSAINNYAASIARGEVLGLVNNDIEVISEGWLDEMVSHALKPGVGAVGAMLYYPDDTIQHAGVVSGLGGVAGHIYSCAPRGFDGYFCRGRLTQVVSIVTGACLVVSRSAFEAVSGLDERLAVAFNDVDFCLRLRDAGYRNIWTPFAELYHHESASRGRDDNPEKQARFAGEIEFMKARYGDSLNYDPFYNPNLSLQLQQEFMIAFPPRF
ncbi:family 2 glycosyl transferase [Lysobacteraceae bacterium NML95-0200]|nr:family 2 glycosyl transferase [Xanthomonadaceae bacterium NML95-0200]